MCFPTDKSETNVIFIGGKMEKKNIKKFHCFQWEQNVYIVFFTVVKDEKQVISLWSEFWKFKNSVSAVLHGLICYEIDSKLL